MFCSFFYFLHFYCLLSSHFFYIYFNFVYHRFTLKVPLSSSRFLRFKSSFLLFFFPFSFSASAPYFILQILPFFHLPVSSLLFIICATFSVSFLCIFPLSLLFISLFHSFILFTLSSSHSFALLTLLPPHLFYLLPLP